MSVNATESIAGWRTQIDALDERIISLLEQRMEFSVRIQQSRMRDGGSRIASDREQGIIRQYADRLGDNGTQIAELILELCRGSAVQT